MSFRPFLSVPRLATVAGIALSLSLFSTTAAAQSRPGKDRPVLGEKYRLELSYAYWKPALQGSVTSDRLDLIGSRVDLVSDLNFGEARFKDWRVTLKPGRKHKLRFQYTPLTYTAEGVLTREITYAGKTFAASLPINSSLEWKVWRFGYEWDFLYKPRGYVGVYMEVRKTQLSAALQSLVAEGSFAAEAPLPAIGIVTRVNPLPDLALNFEWTGLKAPHISDRYSGQYYDMEFSGTVNVTNNIGITAGWRRLDMDLRIDRDFGDLRFAGFWFGGAIRY